MTKRLGIGMVGSGFNAKFHLLGFVGVRDADVLGVWSPNQHNAAETAGIASARSGSSSPVVAEKRRSCAHVARSSWRTNGFVLSGGSGGSTL